MKTIKFLLVSLFMMLGLAAQAQQVVINKTDGTVDVFQLNEVDSVVYKPAPKYYYYIGWECPTNEDDLKRLAVSPNGGKFASLTGLDTTKDYYPNDLSGTRTQWYLVIPSTLNAYDVVTGGLMTDNTENMTKESNQPIANHTIWKSIEASKYIGGLKIY